MSQDYIEYKLIDKKTSKEIKIDKLYYEADTTALQIKIAILKYYGIEEINPEIIKLRSRSYKSNSQDIGLNVELSTIFKDPNSEKNEIIFEINQNFQNAVDTLIAPRKTNKPLQFHIQGVDFEYIGDIKDRLPNGKGQIKYYANENGERTVYEGEVKNGLPDGYGKIIFSGEQHPRVESYQGMFSEGHVTSMRVDSLDNNETVAYIIYRNGDQYEGGTNGYLQPKGMGKMTRSNGDVYVGNFDFGVYNGNGVLISNGQRINGEWKNGKQVTFANDSSDENDTFLENNIPSNKRYSYTSPPNSPERKKSGVSEPPQVNRKKKGGRITIKYRNFLKNKTKRILKKQRSTIKNKKPKPKRATRKYK
jgi:hypothetical protein